MDRWEKKQKQSGAPVGRNKENTVLYQNLKGSEKDKIRQIRALQGGEKKQLLMSKNIQVGH